MNQMDYTTDPELDYLNEDLCDVVFEVEGQRIPASKLRLSYGSRVFRAMFSGKHGGSEDKVIAIEETTAEAFKTFIRSVVTDEWVPPTIKEDNDFELIGQLYRLSDRYEVRRLSDKIIKFIIPFVRSKLRSITRIAYNYQMDPLMAIVVDDIEKNINEIIELNNEELTEINDSTNNLLLDVLTSGLVSPGWGDFTAFEVEKKKIYVKTSVVENIGFERSRGNSYIIEESFEAFKVLIGFLYFNRLIIKDKNDFKLIREVYEMAVKYSINGLMNAISADLKNRITFENLKQILNFSTKFDIRELIENVFEFIRLNAEELVKSDVRLIQEICIIRRKYPTNDLLTAISSVIKNILTFDNMITLLKIIFVFEIKDIMEKVFEFIETNIEELVKRDVEEFISKKTSDLELIPKIFNVINKYKVYVNLKEKMSDLLRKSLTFDNLVIIHKFAVFFNIEDLITNIKNFIFENRKQLKDIKELNEMNNAMNGTLLEVLAEYCANN